MASSKLMASSTSRNSDLIRRRSSSSSTKSSSISELSNHVHHRPTTSSSTTNYFEPTTVDGLLRNVYVDNNEASESTLFDTEITLLDAAADAAAAISDNEANAAISDSEANAAIRWQEIVRSSNGGNKTVDDVWKEIVAGRSCKQEVSDEMMTLEDFLAKAGAVDEEDVKVVPQPLPTERLSGGIYSYDSLPVPVVVDSAVGFGNGVEVIGGRGKRRAILEPLDKAAQQRQRRMIKNRESAARSRERKQAYQVELESLAVKLEEEHEVLLKEKAERTKERFKQLMENIIPVVEKRRPARVLKRVRSMQW